MQAKIDKLIRDLQYLWTSSQDFDLLIDVIKARKEQFPRFYRADQKKEVPDGFYIVRSPDFPYVALKKNKKWYKNSDIFDGPEYMFYGSIPISKAKQPPQL